MFRSLTAKLSFGMVLLLTQSLLAQTPAPAASPAPTAAAAVAAPAATEAAPSGGGIYIKLGEAQKKKSLLAFPALQFVGSPSATPNYQSVGTELYSVISNNLQVSTYFQFIPESAFLEDTKKTGLRPKSAEANGFQFESWKQINAEFLIRASFSIAGDTVSLETYTYHVPREHLILGKRYKGSLKSLRKIAHTFSNDLMEAMTGKKGMFLSRLTYASDRGGGGFREIYTMDWDGVNVEKITNHKSVALSPAWSPDAKRVAYTAFVQRAKTKTRNADMFIYELATDKRWLVSYRQGINSGANFQPDNKNILLTISQGGSPDIYRMSFDGELRGKVTNGPKGSMNVEPAMSPDGSKIAFSSDRSGNPMIFIMNADGSNPKRVTFAGKYNATPAWSPDGSKLAFSGWNSGNFDIYVMNADGTNMIKITSANKSNGKPANNEDPSFSPDGRFLIYSSNRTGKNQLYMSNVDGTEERRVTTDNFNYFKPKWSINVE